MYEDYDDYLESLDYKEPDPDDAYDRHIDAIAHFPDEIFRAVRELPTAQALFEGEKMLKQQSVNREIARSIWGDLSAS